MGIANYPNVQSLPAAVLQDARDLCNLLTEPTRCGYPTRQVTVLLDDQATVARIRAALATLAERTGPNDTAVVFFSGHGAQWGEEQYLLPFDCDLVNLPGTAIGGAEMTALLGNIRADRLLVLLDSCHSGGVGDPKLLLPGFKTGLSEAYYEWLAQGRGRVVMAASRPDEYSWVLPGANNSVFTHYVLEALRGQGKTLGDGYVRVFDLFRHVAEHVPSRAQQHPIFKAAAMESDFPIALIEA